MRDFERDISSASRFRTDLRETEFSWSPARHSLFQTCKRAYFLHYYLTQGGWDSYADPFIFAVYTEKNLLHYKRWLADLFEDALQDAIALLVTFRGPPQEKKKFFLRILLQKLSQKLSRARMELLEAEESEEPKVLRIMEHYYSEEGFETLDLVVSKAASDLKKAWRSFCAVDAVDSFLEIHKMELLPMQKFHSFPFQNFTIWFHPGVLFFRKNTAHAVRIVFDGFDSGNASRQASVFEMYAQRRWQNPEIQYRLLSFNGDETDLAVCSPVQDFDVFIRESVAEMREDFQENKSLFQAGDFPKSDQKENCRSCRFRNTCSTI